VRLDPFNELVTRVDVDPGITVTDMGWAGARHIGSIGHEILLYIKVLRREAGALQDAPSVRAMLFYTGCTGRVRRS
jgi:hypothetical protein